MARPESALVALALLLATTPAHPQPLLGTWVYPSRDVMWELEIGTDAYDDIEGVVCGKNDADGSIWGVRLETIARADEEGNRIRIKNSFLSLSLGLRNPDTIVMQVMDPKKPHKGTINTFDVKRSERTRCTHRFRSAKGPEDHDRLSTGSIVGEWSISRSGVSFAELAIEEIKGRHVWDGCAHGNPTALSSCSISTREGHTEQDTTRVHKPCESWKKRGTKSHGRTNSPGRTTTK